MLTDAEGFYLPLGLSGHFPAGPDRMSGSSGSLLDDNGMSCGTSHSFRFCSVECLSRESCDLPAFKQMSVWEKICMQMRKPSNLTKSQDSLLHSLPCANEISLKLIQYNPTAENPKHVLKNLQELPRRRKPPATGPYQREIETVEGFFLSVAHRISFPRCGSSIFAHPWHCFQFCHATIM